jgi:hypothetical protein
MSTAMRAKLKISSVQQHTSVQSAGAEPTVSGETLNFTAVCRSEGYPADGSDENNTFSKFTPSADLRMYIANPALFGQFKEGDTFYVDFTPAT